MSDFGGDNDDVDNYDQDGFDDFDDEEQNFSDHGSDAGEGIGANGEQDNFITAGDPAAAAAAAAAARGGVKIDEKKIPNDQRTTTPYMTKYEKARLLGTRALQIRWVILASVWLERMDGCVRMLGVGVVRLNGG